MLEIVPVKSTGSQRSKLLELLLGIANLNEYVRHSTVLAPQSN